MSELGPLESSADTLSLPDDLWRLLQQSDISARSTAQGFSPRLRLLMLEMHLQLGLACKHEGGVLLDDPQPEVVRTVQDHVLADLSDGKEVSANVPANVSCPMVNLFYLV